MKTLPLVLPILLSGAGIAPAQTKPKSGSIDLEYKQRAPALQKVPPRKIEEDTTQALSELDRQRTDRMLRESPARPGAAPRSRPGRDAGHPVARPRPLAPLPRPGPLARGPGSLSAPGRRRGSSRGGRARPAPAGPA